LPASANVVRGDYVVTSGTVSTPDESIFPAGIPIGQVTSVEEDNPYKSVNVRPLARLHDLNVVQVLTDTSGSRAARLHRLAASLGSASSTRGAAAPANALAQRGGGG
jgi:cell shape-determining protein MreC